MDAIERIEVSVRTQLIHAIAMETGAFGYINPASFPQLPIEKHEQCLEKFIQSMSGKGNCYDNAVMESFFKTLKIEEVYWQQYLTRDEARKSIFEYIECYYNTKRMHSSLDYMSPQEFENAKILSLEAVH